MFSDGYIDIVPKRVFTSYELNSNLKELAYLVIDLNRCLELFFDYMDLSSSDDFVLSKKEISILSVLRAGNYDEISIQMKNGVIDRIDTKARHLENIGKLSDILNKVVNGDFIIKKQA